MAKTDRKKKRKQLDDLWSELVKRIANYKCEYCGKTTHLNSHHIFSRSIFKLSWDLDNGICLCSGCHTLNNHSAHKAPIQFLEWFKKEKGQDRYDRLLLKSQTVSGKTDLGLIEVYLINESELLDKMDLIRQ